MKPIDITVIGTGMYVCGRGTRGYGAVMPAICEWSKKHPVATVTVVGRSIASLAIAKKKISRLVRDMGVKLFVKYVRLNGKGAYSYAGVLKKTVNPSCALVVVPDDMHATVCSCAMKAGLHTLVVKPLTPTLKEARELLRIQTERDLYCAVEFHKRYDQANMMLKDSIARGDIGDPLYFLAEYSQRKSVPLGHFKKWVRKTNIFQYLGIHYVDIIYFTTGAMPMRAMAIGQKRWLCSKGIDVYDSVCGIVEWRLRSGRRFTSHILTNWIDPESTSAMSDQKIKVVGTKGRFESDQKGRGVKIVSDDCGIEEPNPYFCSPYGPYGKISYQGYGVESICRFLDDISQIGEGAIKAEDLEEDRATFRQALVSTMVLDAVNSSLKKNGSWVAV